ncbi:hypothetical protein [Ralstonia mannitolilytica]|uniref:hypothetical protein n=1 Tax=Ralstonia mannitolilytica TaxID=105219 RepID=UPI001C97CB59|nr:hypothetical protein [Ralstonia mannitolilytica]MBY4717566.1 hypothetical protein [Ralstonia mannitolilytica]
MLFEDMKLIVPGKSTGIEQRAANPVVEKAIAQIQANNEKLTLKKIAKLSGIAYMTLYMSGKYDQYVNKQKKVAQAPVVLEQKEPELLFDVEGTNFVICLPPSKKHFCILVEQTNEIHNVIGTNELDAKIGELLQNGDLTLKICSLLDVVTATRKTIRTKNK